MKIGFFGGCFNPPSNIHINIAKAVLKEFNLDKVIFVPVGNYYDKKDIIDEEHRYNMLKIATQDEETLEVEDITLNSKRKLFAIDTFSLLLEKYSQNEIFFIMGSDNFRKIPNWKEHKTLLEKYNFIVVERERKEVRNIKEKNVLCYIPEKLQNIDSTKIREFIRKDIDISNLIDYKVYEYIKRNNLY